MSVYRMSMVSVLAGLFLQNAAVAFPNVRFFMVPQGTNPSATTFGQNFQVIVPGGSNLTVEFWVENLGTASFGWGAAQATVDCVSFGVFGQIAHVRDSSKVATARLDHIFNGFPGLVGLGAGRCCDGVRPTVGASINDLLVDVGSTPKYLGEMTYTVSGDSAANGSFLSFVPGVAVTFYVNANGTFVPAQLDGLRFFTKGVAQSDTSPCDGNFVTDIDDVLLALDGFSSNETCPPRGTHDCCRAGGPSCTNAAIAACVCAADSFCCDQFSGWDNQCVGEVESLGCGACSSCTAMAATAEATKTSSSPTAAVPVEVEPTTAPTEPVEAGERASEPAVPRR